MSGNQCQELTNPQTDTRTHTETCCSTHPTHSQRFERKMTRSGAARNMGLMRHSRTAMRSAFHPHTGRHAHTSYRNLSRGSVSFFTVSTICRNLSFKYTQTCMHTRTHFPSSLASTSITLRSSSLRFPSPLAMCSLINHHTVASLCVCVCVSVCATEDWRLGYGLRGNCACMQSHKPACLIAYS